MTSPFADRILVADYLNSRYQHTSYYYNHLDYSRNSSRLMYSSPGLYIQLTSVSKSLLAILFILLVGWFFPSTMSTFDSPLNKESKKRKSSSRENSMSVLKPNTPITSIGI